MALEKYLAVALAVILGFAVLAFAGTERWALSALEILIYALGGVWSLWLAFTRARLHLHTGALLPAGVVAWAGLQLALGITVYRFATECFLITWGAWLVLFLVALQIFAESALREMFRRWVLFGGFAIAAVSTIQYFTSEGKIFWIFPTRSGRPFGPFVNPDHYAAFAEILLPMAIFEAVRERSRAWLYTAMAGTLFASVIASGSRAGAALVTLELLVLPLASFRAVSRRHGAAVQAVARTLAMAAVFAALATAVAGWDVLLKRLRDADPFRYRREMLRSTLAMIRERPASGFGMGTYETVYPGYALFDNGLTVDHAHNDWAEWTAEGGLPVLGMWLAIASASLVKARHCPWAMGIFAVFLHSLVDFPLQIPAIAALVCTLLAAVAQASPPASRPSGLDNATSASNT